MGEIKRNADGTIAPGSAAINPSGRPKAVIGLLDLAREACPKIMLELISIAMDRDENLKYRLVAMNAVLDRGLGKPAQSIAIDTNSENKSVGDMTNDEIRLMREQGIEAMIRDLHSKGKLDKILAKG